MSDWENIISFESLYKAHRRSRLGKRHKKEVIEFEAHLSENIWKMHFDLKFENYKVGRYHRFMIYDPKEREIQAIDYRDRVLQHSLCDNYLMPLLERHLIYDNVACRKNRGTKLAFSRLTFFMSNHYKKYGRTGFFVKLDVRHYFQSIDHTVLKQKLIPLVEDVKIRSLLFQIIDSYNYSENRGLPMGNQSSQCFALLYLNALDRFFKEKMRIQCYIRYMDDILILVSNRKLANQCLESAASCLEKEKLLLNPKSQIIPVKLGVSFLGWHFSFSDSGKIVRKLTAEAKRRISVHLKNSLLKSRDNEQTKAVLAAYHGYLQQGNALRFYQKNISAWQEKEK